VDGPNGKRAYPKPQTCNFTFYFNYIAKEESGPSKCCSLRNGQMKGNNLLSTNDFHCTLWDKKGKNK